MARHKTDEDLFQSSTMTFGEHLEELRTCLIRSIYGLVLAFIIALPPLNLAGWAVDFIKSPLEEALQEFYLQRSHDYVNVQLEQLRERGVDVPDESEVQEMLDEDLMMPSVHYVDPRAVFTQLRDSYSKELLPLDVPSFAVSDLLDTRGFCRQLYEEREEENSPSRRVWELLGASARETVKRLAEQQDEGAKVSAADRAQLAAALAAVVDDKDFYREADFKTYESAGIVGMVFNTEQKQQHEKYVKLQAAVDAGHMKQGEPRYNRVLLSIAFPKMLAGGVRRAALLPMVLWRPVNEDPRTSVRSLSAHEMFMIYVKAALVVALVVASPWVFYQLWNFVSAGLYMHERRYVYLFGPISLALFIGGVCLAFFFVFQPVLEFLLWFNKMMDVDPDIRISEWFGFALFLPVGFGIAFQLPLVMLFMERIGIFSVRDYVAKWRVAVLIIFVMSMLLTPADPTSMLLMALPLTVLYWFGILMCRYMPRGRSPFDEPEAIAT